MKPPIAYPNAYPDVSTDFAKAIPSEWEIDRPQAWRRTFFDSVINDELAQADDDLRRGEKRIPLPLTLALLAVASIAAAALAAIVVVAFANPQAAAEWLGRVFA
jgi:hypothetical protein